MGILQKINNKQLLLLKEHVEKVLKSGLLIDEDLERVVDIYENFEEPEIPDKTDFKYVTIGLFVPFLYLLTNSYIFLPVSFVTLFIIIILIIYLIYLDRKARRDFDTIIRNLSQIYKITVSIEKYMKKRHEVAKSKLNPPIALIRSDFVNLVTTQKRTHLQFLEDCIKFVNKHLQQLPNTQQQIDDLNNNLPLVYAMKNQQIDGIDDTLKFEENLKDVSILTTSLFLCSLSYLFGTLVKLNVNCFIYNYRISRIAQISVNYVNDLQSKFDKIQYKYIIKGQPYSKDIVDVFKRNNIREAAIQSVKTASLLFETVNDFYDKLQHFNIDNETDKKTISLYFENLRQDAYDYYKSVDIWCNIYNTSIKNHEKKDAVIEDNVVDEVGKNVNRFEDSLDTIEDVEDLINAMNEEHYEGEGNEESIKFEDTIDEIDKLKQFKMLYMELKHKLKTNRRFKEAQQRRGIDDTNPPERDEIDDLQQLPPPPPPLPPAVHLPPPPPPPLPSVLPIGQQSPAISDRNIRDAIMEAFQRQPGNRKEDTFEHDPDESDSD